jgi:hypothetical protein
MTYYRISLWLSNRADNRAPDATVIAPGATAADAIENGALVTLDPYEREARGYMGTAEPAPAEIVASIEQAEAELADLGL